MKMQALKLCLVTNFGKQKQPFNIYKEIILQAIDGGVTSVQLRENTQPLKEFRQIALLVQAILKPLKVPLIINNHVGIAKDIGADGVHLGPNDGSVEEARKILGPDKIIGLSVYTEQQLEIANQLTCIDYLGVGGVELSKTKPNCIPIGTEGLQKIAQNSKYPVMAIGGINLHNIQAVMEAGVYGVAVVGAIHDAVNAKGVAIGLMTEINQVLDHRGRPCCRP